MLVRARARFVTFAYLVRLNQLVVATISIGLLKLSQTRANHRRWRIAYAAG